MGCSCTLMLHLAEVDWQACYRAKEITQSTVNVALENNDENGDDS